MSILYGIGARWRRRQYDHGTRPVHRADVPVISVGNLTTGGTGKTPIVCDLCSRLRAAQWRVAIVSRGYGADESGINDEAKELHARLPDVPHIQDPDRVEAARIAVDELESQVIVMDDGFQHRRLHRDIDCLVIDATCPFGFGYMLPRGYLREPIDSLARADLVVITRADQVGAEMIEQIKRTVREVKPDMLILQSVHRASGLILDHGDDLPIETIAEKNVALVSAIGNPGAFEQTARDAGANVVAHFQLPDHDGYDREARDRLREWLTNLKQQNEIDWLLCTHKDSVKLKTDRIAGVPLSALKVELVYTEGEADLQRLIDETLANVVSS